MPYQISPDGRVHADTPDEVLSLLARMRAPTPIDPRPSCAEDSWSIFTRALSAEWLASHRHVLSTLKRQNGPLIREAFREALGPRFRSNNVVGGTLAGISRHARKTGLDFATIVIVEGASYRAGPLLRERALPWDEAA